MPSQYHKKQHWTIKKTTQQRRGETNGGSKKGQGTARRLPEHRKKRVRLTLWLVNRKRIPFWSRMPDGHIEHEALSARTLHIQENLWPTRLLLDRLVRKKMISQCYAAGNHQECPPTALPTIDLHAGNPHKLLAPRRCQWSMVCIHQVFWWMKKNGVPWLSPRNNAGNSLESLHHMCVRICC